MAKRFCRLVLLALTLMAVSAAQPPASLWGCWQVKRDIRTPNIAGLSQAEANRIIGRRIFYSESSAKSRDIVLKPPDYETTTLSAETFFENTYVPLDRLGIPGKSVIRINLRSSDKVLKRVPGDLVYLGGKHPVIEVEGVFFELTRVTSKRCGCSPKK